MIDTGRLTLRRWREEDRPIFHAHCSDPEVMRYLGPLMTGADTDVLLARQNGYLDSHGYCFWAVERREDGALLGFCGVKPGAPDTPIAQDVEIGWRFGRACWGQGYAREAAEASLAWAWANTDAPRIAAITVQENTASWGLMERIGMSRVADGDFDHPAVPDTSPLKRHILYRIARPA